MCNRFHAEYHVLLELISVRKRSHKTIMRLSAMEYMPAEPVHKIGIMGTDGTVGAGVYGRECKAAGVEVVYPSEKRQADVMSLIYDDVKAGREPDMDKFDRVMWEFARSGCDRVILACTELSVLQKYREMPEITLDAMDVLVRESIIRSGAPYRL